jgi:hypothetical protein
VRPGGHVVISEPDWETLLVDAPNPDVSRAILTARAQRIPNRHIGRQLRARLIAVGLRNVRVHAETLIVDELASADQLFSLFAAAQAAQEARAVTAADATDWVRSLEEADRVGTFFGAATIFTSAGTKGRD